jgi:hypothetical protein
MFFLEQAPTWGYIRDTNHINRNLNPIIYSSKMQFFTSFLRSIIVGYRQKTCSNSMAQPCQVYTLHLHVFRRLSDHVHFRDLQLQSANVRLAQI